MIAMKRNKNLKNPPNLNNNHKHKNKNNLNKNKLINTKVDILI